MAWVIWLSLCLSLLHAGVITSPVPSDDCTTSSHPQHTLTSNWPKESCPWASSQCFQDTILKKQPCSISGWLKNDCSIFAAWEQSTVTAAHKTVTTTVHTTKTWTDTRSISTKTVPGSHCPFKTATVTRSDEKTIESTVTTATSTVSKTATISSTLESTAIETSTDVIQTTVKTTTDVSTLTSSTTTTTTTSTYTSTATTYVPDILSPRAMQRPTCSVPSYALDWCGIPEFSSVCSCFGYPGITPVTTHTTTCTDFITVCKTLTTTKSECDKEQSTKTVTQDITTTTLVDETSTAFTSTTSTKTLDITPSSPQTTSIKTITIASNQTATFNTTLITPSVSTTTTTTTVTTTTTPVTCASAQPTFILQALSSNTMFPFQGQYVSQGGDDFEYFSTDVSHATDYYLDSNGNFFRTGDPNAAIEAFDGNIDQPENYLILSSLPGTAAVCSTSVGPGEGAFTCTVSGATIGTWQTCDSSGQIYYNEGVDSGCIGFTLTAIPVCVVPVT